MNSFVRRARATKHAIERAMTRLGIELTHDQWSAIVQHARDGVYVEAVGEAAADGATKAFYVPMGASATEAVAVPMVINLDVGIVVTVLDPEPL